MNLHQFRFVQEAVRRDLNLTETAKALFTSQPGVSKAILELEGELGVDIFARHGKRLRRVTEPGREVLKSIEVIMREVGNLKRIGDEFSNTGLVVIPDIREFVMRDDDELNRMLLLEELVAWLQGARPSGPSGPPCPVLPPAA